MQPCTVCPARLPFCSTDHCERRSAAVSAAQRPRVLSRGWREEREPAVQSVVTMEMALIENPARHDEPRLLGDDDEEVGSLPYPAMGTRRELALELRRTLADCTAAWEALPKMEDRRQRAPSSSETEEDGGLAFTRMPSGGSRNTILTSTQVAQLRAAFTRVDVDGDGAITSAEILAAVRSDPDLGGLLGITGTDDERVFEIGRVFHRMDTDDDDSIDVDEFVAFFGKARKVKVRKMAAVQDCRQALAELCSAPSDRSNAFPMSAGKHTLLTAVFAAAIVAAVVASGEGGAWWGMLALDPVFFKSTKSRTTVGIEENQGICGGRSPPNGPGLPLYCEDPGRVVFGDLATLVGALDGESNTCLEEDGVSLDMFLMRCISLCIPVSTAGHNTCFAAWSNTTGGYPFSKSGLNMRYLFEELASESYDTDPVVSLDRLAVKLAGCDYTYRPKDVSRIAVSLDLPQQLSLADLTVLILSLAYDPPISAKETARTIGPPSTLPTQYLKGGSLSRHVRHSLVQLCSDTYDRAAMMYREPGHGSGADAVTRTCLSASIKPWISPSRLGELTNGQKNSGWENATASFEKNLETWESSTSANIAKYVQNQPAEDSETPRTRARFARADTIDVVLQLYYSRLPNVNVGKKTVAQIQAARAYFEAVAGNVDGLADAGELLDLMYGTGALMGDERKRAFRLLGVGHMSLQNDFQMLMREVEHFAQAGNQEECARSLAKAHGVQAKMNEPSFQHSITFTQWVAFAVDNAIPSKDIAKPLVSKENVEALERERAGKGADSETKALLRSFLIISMGLAVPRAMWNNREDKTKFVGPLLGCAVMFIVYGSSFYAPFYWAIVSWKLQGTVPLCTCPVDSPQHVSPAVRCEAASLTKYVLCWADIALTPSVMMSIASFIMAKSDVEQEQVKRASTASRVRLSSVTVSDTLSGTSDDIEASDVWALLVVALQKGQNKVPPGIVLLMAVLETSALFGFPAFVTGGMGVEAVTPAYMDANKGSFQGLGMWAVFVQTIGIVMGVVFGTMSAKALRAGLAAVNQLVSSKPPILSFRHAGESIISAPRVCLDAWLRRAIWIIL